MWNCPANQLPETSAGYGFNSNLNWAQLHLIRKPGQTVSLVDAGINDSLQPTLATHCFPPSRLTFPNIGRPNPRHNSQSVNVAYVDGHSNAQKMIDPFYPDLPGQWTVNGITDINDPNYKDEIWDLY